MPNYLFVDMGFHQGYARRRWQADDDSRGHAASLLYNKPSMMPHPPSTATRSRSWHILVACDACKGVGFRDHRGLARIEEDVIDELASRTEGVCKEGILATEGRWCSRHRRQGDVYTTTRQVQSRMGPWVPLCYAGIRADNVQSQSSRNKSAMPSWLPWT